MLYLLIAGLLSEAVYIMVLWDERAQLTAQNEDLQATLVCFMRERKEREKMLVKVEA